jgi:hypothetical protein
MMPIMHPQPQRSGRKWRRFFRHNPQYVFVIFATVIVVALVAGLMYFITSSDFVKPRN